MWLCYFQEERVTIFCEISQRHHRAVMGVKGTKVQDIEYRFDVKIKFPDRNARGNPYFTCNLYKI